MSKTFESSAAPRPAPRNFCDREGRCGFTDTARGDGVARVIPKLLAQVNLHAARGVAVREFPRAAGHGSADYLLYVDGKACGVIEAKKKGATLSGVEVQSAR